MELFASIALRKSCRKYDMQPLGQDFLDEMDEAIRGFAPLYPGLTPRYRFSQKVKGRFQVQAPHYLILSGTGAPGEAENIGFVFQQLVLWLDGKGMGSVWLGASKDAEAADTRGDILAIGFGRPDEPLHRSLAEFKRKPINEVTGAPDDACIQAAHLAPSGMNTQPWYFDKQGEKTLLYKQKLKPPISLLYKHSDIDMGIGLCHYALACEQNGRAFQFTREQGLPGKAGYLPFGVLG